MQSRPVPCKNPPPTWCVLVVSRRREHTEKLLLDEDIYKYHFVSQGKITIPGMDDAEEARATDVSILPNSTTLTNLNPTLQQQQKKKLHKLSPIHTNTQAKKCPEETCRPIRAKSLVSRLCVLSRSVQSHHL